MVENKTIEFQIRKTNILVRCPHCKKCHYLAIALIDKQPHRGGKQREIVTPYKLPLSKMKI